MMRHTPVLRWIGLICLGWLCVAVSGCTSLTRYRQTLLVLPASPPGSLGAPIGVGQVAASGWYAGYHGVDAVGSVRQGVPGVLVPTSSWGGQVRAGLYEGLELGASTQWAVERNARRSALGVLDLRGDRPAWAVGAHMTGGERFDSGFGFGIRLDVDVHHLPYSQYKLRDDVLLSSGSTSTSTTLTGQVVPGDGAPFYRPLESGYIKPVLVRLTNGVSYEADWLDVSIGFTLSPQVTNNGASDVRPRPLRRGPVAVIPAMDAGVWWHDLRVGGRLWWAARTWGATRFAYTGLGGQLEAEVRLGRDRAR